MFCEKNLVYFTYNATIQHPPNITLHHDASLSSIKKIENHPSIVEIKKSSTVGLSFSIFIQESKLKWNDQWNKVIATQFNDIPIKVIK